MADDTLVCLSIIFPPKVQTMLMIVNCYLVNILIAMQSLDRIVIVVEACKCIMNLEFFRFPRAIDRPIALHLQEIWIWHLFIWIAKVTEPLVLLHSLYDECFGFKFCLHILKLDFECRYYLFEQKHVLAFHGHFALLTFAYVQVRLLNPEFEFITD
jgi:hypothetical protein